MNVMLGWVFEYSLTAMPSEPGERPDHDVDLVLLDQLAGGVTATSGFASDEALMISILRPATMPLRWRTASSAPRMPSCAAGRERAFQRREQADLDRRAPARSRRRAQDGDDADGDDEGRMTSVFLPIVHGLPPL